MKRSGIKSFGGFDGSTGTNKSKFRAARRSSGNFGNREINRLKRTLRLRLTRASRTELLGRILERMQGQELRGLSELVEAIRATGVAGTREMEQIAKYNAYVVRLQRERHEAARPVTTH